MCGSDRLAGLVRAPRALHASLGWSGLRGGVRELELLWGGGMVVIDRCGLYTEQGSWDWLRWVQEFDSEDGGDLSCE